MDSSVLAACIIANCIIYYNSALLSGLVERFETLGNQEVVSLLSNLSPVAWSHIQLAGNYTFARQPEIFSLESMLENVDPLAELASKEDEMIE
ncbi:TPA: Tn3 family transposase [Providencia alcalifaciens]